jgi:hypothetical protein
MREMLLDSGRADLADTAVLLVSEIVTNALLHAGTDIGVTATLDDNGLHVGVSDGSRHLPSRREYGPTSGTGRGLLMLESMVDEWGVTQHRTGKTVWFHVSVADDTEERADNGPVIGSAPTSRRRRSRDGTVPVELRNMPLLLHAAWQEHAEALLREFLLVSLDSDTGDPIQMHADATDAIAVLEEHVPRWRWSRTGSWTTRSSHASRRTGSRSRYPSTRCRTSRPSTGRSRRRSTSPRTGSC